MIAARFLLAELAFVLAITLSGCAGPIEYRPIPAMLIPPMPTPPTIKAAELTCLSDDTYLRLATRDRELRQYADELGALLRLQDAHN